MANWFALVGNDGYVYRVLDKNMPRERVHAYMKTDRGIVASNILFSTAGSFRLDLKRTRIPPRYRTVVIVV